MTEIVQAALSRRALLRAAGAVGGVAALTISTTSPASADRGSFGFRGIAPQPADTDRLVVPSGYEWAPIISWGDPILPGAPEFDFDQQTPAAQAGQFGYNNDYVAILPLAENRALLVCNNEYTNDELMFRGVAGGAALTDDQLRISQLAHGMSLVELHRANRTSPWRYRKHSSYNRRITARTSCDITGPAAGSPLLRTTADPRGTSAIGTIGNCAGGTTPWGTVLSGEENFQGYFASTGPAPADQREAYERYGLSEEGRGWERVDDRFDTAVEPHEPNRFGWIVEVDPFDPDAPPRKLTALGRFRHEGATTTLTDDGRVVAYMGDDQRFDYVYKFVSSQRMRPGRSASDRAHNKTLLDSGDLYVARFSGNSAPDGSSDGTGVWLPLVVNGYSAVPGMTVAEVLIWTRVAADRVGPTKMDRPEDIETNPATGKVYLVCTNNTDRVPSQVDAANPRAANKHGHIIEMAPHGGDHGSRNFSWSLVLVAGDPTDPDTYFAGFPKENVSPISCPDNIAFDRYGNLWIATDGNKLDACDGLYVMPLRGRQRGQLRQFLSVPVGAEVCGPVIARDNRSVVIAVQHPGETDEASPDSPASLFPYQGDQQPRPAVVQAYRTDHGHLVRG
ncbi:MAG: PhoX family protein [Actinomycetota bacterium]